MKKSSSLCRASRWSFGRRRRMARLGGAAAFRAQQPDSAVGGGQVNQRSAFANRARNRGVVSFGCDLQVRAGEIRFDLTVPRIGLDLETAARRDAELNAAPFELDPDIVRQGGIGGQANVPVGIPDIHVVLEAVEVDVLVLRGQDERPLDAVGVERVHFHVQTAREVLDIQIGACGIEAQGSGQVLKRHRPAEISDDRDGAGDVADPPLAWTLTRPSALLT